MKQIQTFSVPSLGKHNELPDLQGGNSLSGQYFHLSSGQYNSSIEFSNYSVETTTPLSSNTNKIPTSYVVKNAIDSIIPDLDALVYKGAINCSTNPNYPAADSGHTYKISIAGKIGGVSGVNVEIGDLAICFVDSTPSGDQASVGANWDIIQANIDGAVIGPASSTFNSIPSFANTSGKLLQDSGYIAQDSSISQKGFVQLSNLTSGMSQSLAATEYALNNGLNNKISFSSNILYVVPNDHEIVGKQYQTIQAAIDYAISTTPSSENRWVIQFTGNNSENFSVENYVTIRGVGIGSSLTGIVSSNAVECSPLYLACIENCYVYNLDIGVSNLIILKECTVSADSTGEGTVFLMQSSVHGGDYSDLAVLISIQSYFVSYIGKDVTYPSYFFSENCVFTGWTGNHYFKGGSFYNCTLDCSSQNYVSPTSVTFTFINCYLNFPYFTLSAYATMYLFNSYLTYLVITANSNLTSRDSRIVQLYRNPGSYWSNLGASYNTDNSELVSEDIQSAVDEVANIITPHVIDYINPHLTTLQQVTNEGNSTNLQIISTYTSGSPLQVYSSGTVTNFNSDYVDGFHALDIDYSEKNILLVLPDSNEVIGKRYKTIQTAIDYAISTTLSASNRYTIKFTGINNETLLNIPRYITITGLSWNDTLTGQVGTQSLIKEDWKISGYTEPIVKNCTINQIYVDGICCLIIQNCYIKSASGSGYIFVMDGVIESGDYSSLQEIYIVNIKNTYNINSSFTFPTTTAINCSFNFSNLYLLNNTVKFDNCSFNISNIYYSSSTTIYFNECFVNISNSNNLSQGYVYLNNSYLSMLYLDNGGNLYNYNSSIQTFNYNPSLSSTWNNYGSIYDNRTSGLLSKNTQAAIDEISSTVDTNGLQQVTDIGSTTNNQIIITTSGSAPLQVTSNTLVTNFNSDLLDGHDSTYFQASLRNQGTTNYVLHGNATGEPAFGYVTEADIYLLDNTTNNVDNSKHGFTPKLSNDSNQFLNGQGNWATPAGIVNSYISQSFSNQTSVNVIHNFGAYPIIQVLDSSKNVFISYGVTHNSLNDFTISFTVLSTGTILASVGSPQPQSVISVSNDYSVLASDRIIKVSASGKTITLPTASGISGREYIIDNASTGDINTIVSGSGYIQGELIQVVPPDSAMQVYSDGTGYRIC